ncbi:MAG: tetratricopeptide repeat protein [Anaerolineae bacterium]|nr:tetratricopeptide repeat protein [Anaerolineae bacterium]
MRIVTIVVLGLLLVGCGGAAVDLPTATPAPPAAPAATLPPSTEAPSPTALPPTVVPVADLIAEGDALVEEGNLEEAMRVYKRALSLDPESAAAHNALGVAYGLSGDLDQAVFELLEALRIAPDNGTVHSNLCKTYTDQNKLEEALAECLEAIRLTPDSAQAYVNTGVVYERMGRLKEARDAYERAVELEPDSPQREAVETAIAYLQSPQMELGGEYVDAFGFYKVSHPADWVAQSQDEPGMVLLGADVADPDPFVLILTRALSFFAAKLDLEEITTVGEFATGMAPQYGIDPQTLESGTVAGVPALSGVWNGANNSGQTIGRVSFFVDRGMGYLFTYQATPDQADAFAPTAQAMLDSFTFVEPAVTVAYSNPAAGYELLYPEGWVVDPQERLVQFTPVPDMTAADGPAVALFAGQDNLADTFQVEGELSTESIIEAFATLAEAQLGDRGAVDLGGEPTTLVEVQTEIDGVPVAGILVVWDPVTRPLVALGLAPASQWGPVSPTFVTMMHSLAFSAAAEPSTVDFTDPAAVVQAVFDAAASQDFSVLASLCDPLGENDEDTAMICAITDSHASRDSFVEYFRKGKIVGEAIFHGDDQAEVQFLYGPEGDEPETVHLIKRDGKWYLLGF